VHVPLTLQGAQLPNRDPLAPDRGLSPVLPRLLTAAFVQLPVLSAGKLEESGAMIKVGLAELGELPTPTLVPNCH
jgi:hypothetical protein